MKITINLPLTPKQEFPDGAFNVSITDVTEGVSEKASAPFFLVKFEDKAHFIYKRLYYSNEKSHEIVGKLFKSCGILKPEDGGNLDIDSNDLKGKKLKIFVNKRTYQDKQFQDVYDFAKFDGEIEQHTSEEGEDLPF